jgi:serine/threonine protein kinase
VPQNKLRSTILYAFTAKTPSEQREALAATTPAPREEKPAYDPAPDIEVDERITLTPIGDGPNEVQRTFASIPPPPSMLLPEEGDVVGEHYQLVRKLGEGTFGRVYVAQRIDVPEHQVALKLLPRSLYVGRNVDRELVMLATVGHPHVVQLKDHGTTDEYVWLTMPVYEGQTLQERLEQKGTLSLREAYDIFRAIAYGLEALHDAGLRHQDIKPENIYLAVFGRRLHPVLLDLGVAAEKEASFIAGTALYASPEQIFALDGSASRPPLTEKMDTYCFATTLLVSLVGPQYFPGDTATQPAELALAHAVRASTPIAKEALPDLTGKPRQMLIDTFKKWLALEPKDRPSMKEVAEQLDVLLEKEREEKRQEERNKEQQKAALLRFRIAVVGLMIGALATAGVVFAKRETLRLATELEQAKSESFDNLVQCNASHKVAASEAAACKTAREKDQAEFQRSLDLLSNKKGADADRVREMQTMVTSYTGKLKACEDGAQLAQKTCIEDNSRLVALAEKEKAEIARARDEQKSLADAREKELASLKTERDTCASERATCLEQKAACVDQKAQILIACAGTPTRSSAGSGGGTVPAGSSAPAPGPAAPGNNGTPASTGTPVAQPQQAPAPQPPPPSPAPAPT